MNLADAIRQAARQEIAPSPVTPPPVLSVNEPVPASGDSALTSEVTMSTASNPVPSSAPEAKMPEPPSPAVMSGSVVRLELFLGPEQLTSLFRGVVATQHTVMTLREAATMLRVSPSVLQQMAVDREIPALQIDGKWRFPRAGVEEWVALQSAQGEAE